MSLRSSGVMAGEGASSMSFWWRRCTEQSRSLRCTTRPCVSPKTWISTCRGRSRYFSMYTASLPKAASASPRASWKWRPKSSSSGATRIPFPPPPAAALMMTGKPISRAAASASSTSATGPGVPGTMGSPAACARRRASALSPMLRICSGVGPMKVMFDALTISANSAFSARNP